MFHLEISTQGIEGWALLLLLICTPLVIVGVFDYVTDPEYRKKINRSFIKIPLEIASLFSYVFKREKAVIGKFAFCKLGDPNSESGADGISYINFKDDGKAVREIVDTEYVRRTNNRNGDLYLYFSFREDVVEKFRNRPIILLIEYLDRDAGNNGSTEDSGKRGLRLKYDSLGEEFDARWKMAGQVNFTEIEGGWKWAGFNIDDGYFHRRQNRTGDFRVACRYASPKRDYDLFVRRVAAIIV